MTRQHGDHLRSWTRAPDSEDVKRPAGFRGGEVRGKLTRGAPLAKLVWFKSGGAADWLFEPEDLADLIVFLAGLEEGTPVMALGLGSNLIVRDGGVPGVVVRLGKAFADVTAREDYVLKCGGGARNRSRCAPRPAARPSRTRRATRPGGWSTRQAAAA